ncbi:MAG TPA: serine hydrolase domain-containing protein [Thermoanaerobaculia bacterium]|nr:serine hydrolase domain-containing protein [Thermoanaerobaculia bacterium]
MRTLAIVLFLLSPLSAAAQQSFDATAFEAFTERQMKADRMTGLSVAVLQGERLWARGFGLADVENQVPATEKSSYRMASVSKPMTAVAAIRLAEMGKLDLDAPVQKYVSYFPDKGKTITTRQLLAHLGGISHYRNYRVEGNIREPKTTREAIDIFAAFDLVNEPGSAYSYSSYGYNLAGAVIEAAAGKPYADVMQELVWGPAGMTSTRMDSWTDIIPNRVSGYQLDNGKLKRSDFVDISSRFAAGGTRSTVVDMVRFAKAVDDGKLIGAESIDRMWWPSRTTSGKFVDYGLGWSVHSVNGHYQVAHSGSQQETRTLLIHFPQRDLAIAFASNFENADFRSYRNYLYWLLTGEAWNPPAYASDPADRAVLDLATRLVDAGGLYFEKYGRPMTTDRRELQKAFANRSDEHPFAAGSWIVSKAGVRDDGALAVLKRYVESKQQPRFDRPTERRIVELANAWRQAWNAETFISGEKIEEAVASYKGLRVVPSYAGKLVSEVEASFHRGDVARAGRLSQLAAEIYPQNDAAAGVHGIYLAISGNEKEAETWLRRSRELEPEGYASDRRLEAVARQVESAGHSEGAATLRRLALKLKSGVRSGNST